MSSLDRDVRQYEGMMRRHYRLPGGRASSPQRIEVQVAATRNLDLDLDAYEPARIDSAVRP